MEWSNIKEMIEAFEKNECGKYLKSIIDFFFNPKKFWSEFVKLSPKQKVLQIAIYSLLIVVVAFALSNSEYTPNKVAKFLLKETATLLPLWIVSTTVIFATKRFHPLKDSAINAFFVVYYTKALFCSFQSLFLYLYANNESYVWLFLASLISVAAEIYIIVVSILIAGLETSVKRTIWLGIVFSLVGFTVVDGADMLWKTGRTKGEENFSNNVDSERKARLSCLSTEFLIPQVVLFCPGDTSLIYLYAKPNDKELTPLEVSNDVYISKIQSDIALLKATLPNVRFGSNKKYIQDMIRIKEAVIYTFEHKNFSKTKRADMLYYNNGVPVNVYSVAFNESISADNAELMKSYCWRICQYDMAISPMLFQLLYRPLVLIQYLKKDKRALAPQQVNTWETYFYLKKSSNTFRITLHTSALKNCH